MLRLTFCLLLAGSILCAAESVPSTSDQSKNDPADATSLLIDRVSKIDPGTNPFTAPSSTNNDGTANLGAAAALSGVGGVIYGINGQGCISFSGTPWNTGESRPLAISGTRINVTLSSITPPSDNTLGSAIFVVGEGKLSREIQIDIPGATTELKAEESIIGWVVSPHAVVTWSEVPEHPKVRVNNRTFLGTVVAHSKNTGLTLLELDSECGLPAPVSADCPQGEVIVLPVTGKPFRVPSSILSQAPKESVIGSAVLTSDGRFIGLLSKGGMTSMKALGSNNIGDSAKVSAYSYIAYIK